MKKILSFVLALVMIASMAVVAFAEGEAATTPTPATINTEAADYDANLIVPAPEAVAGKEGFETGYAVKINEARNYQELWKIADAKAGDTMFVFYYVESANVESFVWTPDGGFTPMDVTPGYHVAEVHLNNDITKVGLHIKNGDTISMYVGNITVWNGGISFPKYLNKEAISDVTFTAEEVYTKAAANEAAGATWYGGGKAIETKDVPAEVKAAFEAAGKTIGEKAPFVVNANGTDPSVAFMNWYRFETGYKYTMEVDVYVVSGKAGFNNVIANGGTNDWPGSNLAAAQGLTTLTMEYTPTAWTQNLGLYSVFEGYVGEIRITSVPVDVINQYTEYTYLPEKLYTTKHEGIYLTDNKDGLVFTPAFIQSNTYAQATSAMGSYGAGWTCPKRATFYYDVVGGSLGSIWLGGTMGDFGINVEPGTGYTTVKEASDFAILNIIYGPQSDVQGSLVLRKVVIENVEDNYLKSTTTPFDTITETKLVQMGQKGDILAGLGETFTADKVFVATVNYKIYAKPNAANAPTLTIGDQSVVLKRTSGEYSVSVGITAGATAIVVDAKDCTVFLGDVTYIEAGEDYKKLQDAVTVIPTTLKLDQTIANTPEAAATYITKQLNELYGDKYDIVDVTVVDSDDAFIPYADDVATVTTASAASNGSVTVEVSLVEKATSLPCTMTLTFDIVKGSISEYDAVVSTGDSAIIAVVALIAVISLAGVVIAKKKVASK